MVNMGNNAKIPDVLHSLWAKVKKGGLHRPFPAAFQLKPKGFLKFVFFGRVFGLSPVVRGCRPRPQRGTGAPKVASAPRGASGPHPCGPPGSIPPAGGSMRFRCSTYKTVFLNPSFCLLPFSLPSPNQKTA